MTSTAFKALKKKTKWEILPRFFAERPAIWFWNFANNLGQYIIIIIYKKYAKGKYEKRWVCFELLQISSIERTSRRWHEIISQVKSENVPKWRQKDSDSRLWKKLINSLLPDYLVKRGPIFRRSSPNILGHSFEHLL